MKIVLLTEREDGGYRPMSQSERDKRLEKGLITLEGVDGDEETLTVTRWYKLQG